MTDIYVRAGVHGCGGCGSRNRVSVRGVQPYQGETLQANHPPKPAVNLSGRAVGGCMSTNSARTNETNSRQNLQSADT